MAKAALKTQHSFTSRKRIRKSFGKLKSSAIMPNLIEIQKNSYDLFLQYNQAADVRKTAGLFNVMK
ncbi:MAG: hypothetical protein EB059_11135, partial [Alphaproteobacteria bacterium]|nr:hypothetical protein [Alphaproteobacteria bacterium]